MEKSGMTGSDHISTKALELGLDYQVLRANGLDFIQRYGGTRWTNLNPSDPGIAFLDELCFALTELGYCTHFPIHDLLSQSDGQIRLDNQFYLPEECLMTAPISVNDFRKYVIDSVAGVENLTFERATNSTAVYAVQLKLNHELKIASQQAIVVDAVFYALNKSRNLGQNFMYPSILEPITISIKGSLSLISPNDLVSFISDLNAASESLIFPAVQSSSLKKGRMVRSNVDKPFDGPFLQHGAITDRELGTKKDVIADFEVVNLIRNLVQVKGVNVLNLFMPDGSQIKKVSVLSNQLIELDWTSSILDGSLEIYANGQLLMPESNQVTLQQQLENGRERQYSLSELSHSIPGNYRDVNTFYSIQNTLPNVFNVGLDALNEKDSDLKKGTTKQLKAYLSFFDQILANQFAQLANLGTLFSFKNTTIGAPSDVTNYLANQNRLTQIEQEYPAAYKVNSPTYFYQSIYASPNIRPILRRYDSLDFTLNFGTSAELAEEGWKKYQNDPYNPYMKGLSDLMANELNDLERRNAILDHLLARHGESPALFNELIEGSLYAGNRLMDQVIFKSVFLQNFGVLSYNRGRSFASGFAKPLVENFSASAIDYQALANEINIHDFIMDFNKIDAIERINLEDFTNFSGIELKISLLLGLKSSYKDFIVSYKDDTTFETKSAQLNWLLNEQKGLILNELILLDSTGRETDLADLNFIFPAFATKDINPNFASRIELILTDSLPVNCTYHVYYLSEEELTPFIPAFAKWHNALNFNSKANHNDMETNAFDLINLLKTYANG